MKRQLAALATAAASAAAVAVAAQGAEGAVVSLRVESGADPTPLFEGMVSTAPHAVDGGDGSGPHPCWGPPGGTPAPTATGALDDALKGVGISWRGNWDPSFHDFFIDRISPYASAPPDSYWSLSVNGHFSAGGCLSRVSDGDSVRFFYGPLFGGGPEGGGPGEPSSGPHGGGASPKGTGAGQPAPRRRIAVAAGRYLRRAEDEGRGEAWSGLALAVRGGSGTAAAADLLAGRLGQQRRNGSIEGDVNATAVAVLALRERRPRRAARAAAWLAGAQSTSGGLGYRAGVPPDVDTTGLAAWALAAAGEESAARLSGAYVRATQNADGGFPSVPGGRSNSQSTGLGIIALRVSGIGPNRAVSQTGLTPLDFLAALSRRDGSIPYDRRSNPTPVWTTSQALLGLTARVKLLGLDRRSAPLDGIVRLIIRAP